jgi:REP element-mobilizing transposase RayT
MARTIYSEIHLHVTWHTKNNAPVITGSIETQLYRWLRGRILQAPGVLLHAIGGTDDPVQLAVTVPRNRGTVTSAAAKSARINADP